MGGTIAITGILIWYCLSYISQTCSLFCHIQITHLNSINYHLKFQPTRMKKLQGSWDPDSIHLEKDWISNVINYFIHLTVLLKAPLNLENTLCFINRLYRYESQKNVFSTSHVKIWFSTVLCSSIKFIYHCHPSHMNT